MKSHKILDLIGNTPLVETTNLIKNKNVKLLLKLEGNNPGGSVKDRAAYNMIASAIERGDIKKGDKLIEATSGNTGIALAMIAQLFNVEIELVLPEDSTKERTQTMRAYGATVILTPAKEGIIGSRNYADKNISMIPLSKYVKHTVFKYLGWLDIDWVKGHPSIAISIAKSVGLSLPAFEKYVNEFDDIVKTLSEFYSADLENPLTKDNIKWLFNSMIYGGGFESWVVGISKGDENYSPKQMKNEKVMHDLVKDFKAECVMLTNRIFKENPSLVKKVADPNDEIYKKKNTTASYWFQIIENHVIHLVAGFLLERGIIKPGEFGCEYDGLNIPPCYAFDKDQLISQVNEFIKEQTGCDFTFKFKDYDEAYILNNVIDIRRKSNYLMVEDEDDEENNERSDGLRPIEEKDGFIEMAEQFEKTNAKKLSKGVYVNKKTIKILFVQKHN